jgi:hypothetical protein
VQTFESRRIEIREDHLGTPVYPRDRLEKLVHKTEKDVLKILRDQDLAGLRAKVMDTFDAAQGDLAQTGRDGLLGPRPTLRLDTLSPMAAAGGDGGAADGVPAASADPILDLLRNFLQFLVDRVRGKTLYVDLCVTSSPAEGAKVVLSALGKKVQTTRTIQQVSLVRGKYLCQVTKKPYASIPQPDGYCEADIWNLQRPFLDCRLEEGECYAREGGPGERCDS